jgi:hypothetical protein
MTFVEPFAWFATENNLDRRNLLRPLKFSTETQRLKAISLLTLIVFFLEARSLTVPSRYPYGPAKEPSIYHHEASLNEMVALESLKLTTVIY